MSESGPTDGVWRLADEAVRRYQPVLDRLEEGPDDIPSLAVGSRVI